MNKSEFVKNYIGTFGYTDVNVSKYKASDGKTIWWVKAFKKDARGSISIDFQEAGFEVFIKNLSLLLCRK